MGLLSYLRKPFSCFARDTVCPCPDRQKMALLNHFYSSLGKTHKIFCPKSFLCYQYLLTLPKIN